MKKVYIVWNNDKTEGFVTLDEGLAYEARKGAKSNCYYEDGTCSKLAQKFCKIYSEVEDCDTEEVIIE
jgi:hypothetical protein